MVSDTTKVVQSFMEVCHCAHTLEKTQEYRHLHRDRLYSHTPARFV